MTLISIIIPAYNAQKFVNRCLDSILSQTFKPDFARRRMRR
ncbi:MAG: glycosyltransferase family 2 protein [Methanolinea sp.]|nr:MAG: glycosyltransferase family 2 protein [Methanolinea sp.]